MSDSEYPKPVIEVVNTLGELFQNSGQPDIVGLLDHSQATFELINYDNWNGGTSTWALCLEVPVSVYSVVETELEAVKEKILERLKPFDERFPNDPIGEVRVTPVPSNSPSLPTNTSPPEAEVSHLWSDGKFRLFLSHLATHKVNVSSLKLQLSHFGVDGFVAHEDIEPSELWQNEIELALKSMHALVALVTPRFKESSWTDQEVGWAIGRGIPVIPVRLGHDPYGFLGKFQAISGSLEAPQPLAKEIVRILVSKPRISHVVRNALVRALSNSESFRVSKDVTDFLVECTEFTDIEKVILQQACKENYQVSSAFGVTNRIQKLIGDDPTDR